MKNDRSTATPALSWPFVAALGVGLVSAACAAGGALDDEEPGSLAPLDAGQGAAPGRGGPASPPRGGDEGEASTDPGRMGSSSSSGSGSSSSGSGSSSSGSPSAASPVIVPDGAVVRRAEDCWDIGMGTEALTLGTTLVLDMPTPWTPTLVLGVPPQNVPGVQVGSGDPGRTRVLVPFGSPIEWYLGLARFQIEQPGDEANARACYFDVSAPGWLHQRTAFWYANGTQTVDKDVGTMQVGSGLVIEGDIFGPPDQRTQLESSPGGLVPERTTDFGYSGEGAHVFQPTAPGDYGFDLRITYPNGTNKLYHVHFHAIP